jgi:hypothetical protein
MRKLLFAIVFLGLSVVSKAQNPPPTAGYVQYQSTAPLGSCTLPNYLTVVTLGSQAGLYQCKGSPLEWTLLLGSGSVVSSINNVAGGFTFTGPGVTCTGTLCTFTSGSGVTSITWNLPTWLTPSPSTLSAGGTQTFAPTTGQTSHLVIGTCGTLTQFQPCALVAADIPALPYLPNTSQVPNTFAAIAHNFLTSYTASSGNFTAAQPAFTDISGSVQASQMPGLTGDITSSAGTVGTTLATVNSGPGTCGDATHVCQVTTNAKGLTLSQTAVAISASGGTTTNPLTMNNSGSGAASGSTFNGSAAATISYNTIGAAAATALTLNWTFNTGSPATDASPRFLAAHAGVISTCYALTTASDGSTALTFNIFDNGTSIFSGGAQTIAAGTSAGTLTTLGSLGTTSIANNDKISINITSGTSNWVFSLKCS